MAEWISVKDRLPEPGEVVLATAGGFVGEAYRDDNGYWRRGYGAEWLAIFGKDMAVTHWCSLPEPPGEEVEE